MKRLVVTHRRSEIFIVRGGARQTQSGYCPRCSKPVDLLNIDSAVTVFATSTRELFRLIEMGSIHTIETASGHLLICGSSLDGFIHGENR